MGHVTNPEREYRLLQQRLDRTVTGAPASPTFTKILQILFSPDEAAFAHRMPSMPTSLERLSKKLDIPADELEGQLTEMARRGVVLDMEYKGRRYFMLPPVVVGFFEFSLMRTREDMPQAELARLFHEYMDESDRFAHSLFRGSTQVGRSLVNEAALPGARPAALPGARPAALPEGDQTEILDWERASALITSATSLSVGICPCRHKAGHAGTACDAPLEVCLSLNAGADTLIRSGISKAISTAEGMAILERCREAGLAQTADNVQRNVTFMCNCCGCCCGMMKGIRTFGIKNAVVSSNWLAHVTPEACTGCGACVKACPINAIGLVEKEGAEDDGAKGRRQAVVDTELCIGCGVCHGSCKFDAIRLKSRDKRVFTPENAFDRIVTMAIERGKLADLLFETPEQWSHRALGRVLGVLEKTPPWKAAMAVKPLRSAFLNAMVKGMKAK